MTLSHGSFHMHCCCSFISLGFAHVLTFSDAPVLQELYSWQSPKDLQVEETFRISELEEKVK